MPKKKSRQLKQFPKNQLLSHLLQIHSMKSLLEERNSNFQNTPKKEKLPNNPKNQHQNQNQLQKQNLLLLPLKLLLVIMMKYQLVEVDKKHLASLTNCQSVNQTLSKCQSFLKRDSKPQLKPTTQCLKN